LRQGSPGYDSIIPIEKGTIGTMLKENGYATSWFGKNHNTPSYQSSQAGPFQQWPNGMGFEYFWGFVGGDASQWQPNLFRNTTAIYPYQDNPDWNMETAMADEAIHYMKQLKEVAPGKPWLVYYRYRVPFKFTGKIDKLTFNLAAVTRTGSESKAEMGATMTAPEPDPIDETQ